MTSRHTLFLSAALLASASAQAQINGFNGGTGYSINGGGFSGDLPTFGSNSLQITTGQDWEATSSFYQTPVNVGGFTASFTYQLSPNYPNDGFSPADGFTFTLQNDSRGTAALGEQGEDLGYGNANGITPSVAVAFDLYQYNGVGTNLLTNGNNTYAYNDVSPVNLIGDPIQVSLSYNGSTLTETLDDLTSSATYQTSYSIDIASAVGGPTAYVGFTGGTGLGSSTQTISNFQFQAVPEPTTWAALSLGLLALRRRLKG